MWHWDVGPEISVINPHPVKDYPDLLQSRRNCCPGFCGPDRVGSYGGLRRFGPHGAQIIRLVPRGQGAALSNRASAPAQVAGRLAVIGLKTRDLAAT